MVYTLVVLGQIGLAPLKVGTGNGLTVMVKVLEAPLHVMPPLLKTGVTVIVAIIGNEVVFVAANAGILPVPLAASPIEGALFVH